MNIVRRKLLLETIGTYRVKDETKFKNNINNVTCEAKLIKTFPSIVPYITSQVLTTFYLSLFTVD